MSSLAMVAGEDRTVEARWFRFTVKCDRDMNRKIEIAARKAGLSVESFVQQHFERILDAPEKTAKAGAASAFGAGFDLIDFAKRHGIPLQAARLWQALVLRADEQGLVAVSYREMSKWLGMAESSGSLTARSQLIGAELLADLGGAGRQGTLYRVKGGQP